MSDSRFAAIERWFTAALVAVDPAEAVRRHLRRTDAGVAIDGHELRVPGRIVVAAIGKAAQPMARGAIDVLGDAVAGGLILTKEGHLDGDAPAGFESFEARHPIPDARGVAATQRLLGLLAPLRADDFVLALISGGGSALLETPLADVTLADVATTTDLLLRAGAPIQDLNAVRIPLSRVKGGGMRRATPARFGTLILSDVLGNDTRVIASGPTVPTDLDRAGAKRVLERFSLLDRVPAAVGRALQGTGGSLDNVMFDGDCVAIVGDNATAVSAFGAAAEAEGTASEIVWTAREGEARALATTWVDVLAGVDQDAELLLGGGEATVTVRGDGVGGRNTEFALAAALELERRGLRDWIVASIATDGQDALTGVAGAIAGVETLERAREAGVDPTGALERNDSLAVFRAAGGSVETGPTGTNVNDIYIGLRRRA